MVHSICCRVFVFLMCLYMPLQAQQLSQTIRGRVSDKDTKISLPGATVVVLGTEPLLGTVSDAAGYFKIEGVPVGRRSISVSFLGYEVFLVNETEVSAAKETYLNVELRQRVLVSDEVVITAPYHKQDAINDMSLVSTRSFSVEETGRYAASWGDPSRMAANFAGVSVVSDKRNDIIVRGNSPMGVLWKLDGVDIPNPNHFAVAGSSGGAISMINNNLLDNSDFHSGAFAPEYGNALAAVFDLRLRNGNNEKREYLFQAGVNGFEGGAEGPFMKGRKASYLISYRYSTLTLLDMAGISIIEAIPNFQDLSLKLNFPLKKGFISVFGIAGLSMADYKPEKSTAFLSDERNRWGYVSGTRMGVTAITFQHLLSNKTYMRCALSASAYNPFDKSDSTGLDFVVYPKYENAFSEYRTTATLFFNTKPNSRNVIGWGAAFTGIEGMNNSYTLNYSPAYDKFVLSDAGGRLGLGRAFVQWMHSPNNALTFTSGLNAQYLTLNNKARIEPRAGLSWKLNARHTLSAGFGMHSQTQPVALYFMEFDDSLGQKSMPNKTLGFSESMHYVLGWQAILTSHIRFKSELFLQQLSHIPVSVANPYFSLLNFATDDNVFNYNNLTPKGEGRNYGIEMTLEKFLSKGTYFLLTGTLFSSHYKDGFNTWRSTRFNTNYLLSVLAGKDLRFKKLKNSVFGVHARVSYIGGQRYTPIHLEASRLAGQAVYVDSLSYGSRYTPFIKCDVRLRYRLDMKRAAFELALDVTNVFNRKNVEFMRYDSYMQDIRYVYNLERIPVVFIRVEF